MSLPFNHSHFQATLQTCMLADKYALRRKARDVEDLLKQKDEKSIQKAQRLINEIAQKISISQAKYAVRLANLPRPEYPLELPVSARRVGLPALR